jgi:glutamate-5-semialdehyde dehydrogenase
MLVGSSADSRSLQNSVADSLDREVCNALNTCCIPQSEAPRLVPALLEGLRIAADRRSANYKLHVAAGSEAHVPAELFQKKVVICRAKGPEMEAQAEIIGADQLGREWEWEDSPELTLRIVSDTSEAAALFNQQSPQFIASIVTANETERKTLWQELNAPFVGDGFTRWVDGQYALGKPELGLSNWERGRLFGRGGVLCGDSVYSVRTRVTGTAAGKPNATGSMHAGKPSLADVSAGKLNAAGTFPGKPGPTKTHAGKPYLESAGRQSPTKRSVAKPKAEDEYRDQ